MARRPFFKAASTVAGILILAAGCADSSPTAVQVTETTLSASSAPKGPRANVVQTVFAAGSYAAVIGPQGGTIDFGIGSIHFPAGAVPRATRITATTDGQNIGVTFSPHGLQFPGNAQPVLTFRVGAEVTGFQSAGIVYVSETLTVLETIATSHDIAMGEARGLLAHFSAYAYAKD